MGKFSFWGEWRVLDDEFDFGYVEFGLMKHYCVALWQTHSTGLNIYKDVRLYFRGDNSRFWKR